MTKNSESIDEVCHEIEKFFAMLTRSETSIDSITRSTDNCKELRVTARDSARRDEDPLMLTGVTFNGNSRVCFRESSLLFDEKSSKVLVLARSANPEPSAEHIADLFALMARLTSPLFAFVNLPGAGASEPQHWHAQIVNSSVMLKSLLRIEASENLISTADERIDEFLNPAWGFRIQPTLGALRKDHAVLFHKAVHVGLRYRSRLTLSYNLFVPSGANQAVIIPRNPQFETPFTLPSVISLVRRTIKDRGIQDAVLRKNARWKWGALESIGDLYPRHAAMLECDSRFFDELLTLLKFKELHMQKVRASLTKEVRKIRCMNRSNV